MSRQKASQAAQSSYDVSKDVGIESMQPVVHFNMMEDQKIDQSNNPIINANNKKEEKKKKKKKKKKDNTSK